MNHILYTKYHECVAAFMTPRRMIGRVLFFGFYHFWFVSFKA